ncbi:MAG: NACHT domain-containing protein, partial [Cyanobium sp.]
LQGYRQAITNQYRHLKLEKMAASSSDLRPVLATSLFIEQNARECEFLPTALGFPKEHQRRLQQEVALEGEKIGEEERERLRSFLVQSPKPITEVVTDPNMRKLVVLGDPGSGKSLFLQVLALRWAEEAPESGETPLPLLIELRDYALQREEGLVQGFLDYLANAESLRWRFQRKPLEQWLRQKPSRVLFDGLDEVFDPDLQREVSTAIHRFADENPSAQVVVTSRNHDFLIQHWRDENFRSFILEELNDKQKDKFLRRWHQEAYTDEIKGESKRALLANAINRTPAINELAGNPLLLTMIAIVNDTQELPRDRPELYNQCARLLLSQWKTDVAFATDPYLAEAYLDFKDKCSLLMRVAWDIQYNSSSNAGIQGNLIKESQLELALAEELEGFPRLRPARAARALIEQLRGRNFILSAVGNGYYGFVHRSFQEYFCAAEIKDRFESKQTLCLADLKKEVFTHWPDRNWHEVLTLTAGMIAPRFAEKIILWLLDHPSSNTSLEHLFLAARCVEEVHNRREILAADSAVLERLKTLVWPHKLEDEIALFPITLQMNKPIEQRTLEAICRGWKHSDETKAWVKGLAQLTQRPIAAFIAVREVARTWRDDPETVPWLKGLVLSDSHSYVRENAVVELALGWEEDTGTAPFIRSLATAETDINVQRAALRVLPAWKEHPETMAILHNSVQNICLGRKVRQTALKALLVAYPDHNESFNLVKKLARHDKVWQIRRFSIELLARKWRDHPETFSILTQGKSDAHSSVRTKAMNELKRRWKVDQEDGTSQDKST